VEERTPGEDQDFGDARDSVLAPGYPTLLANNGARHIVYTNFVLGTNIDAEPDGQPTPPFDGDDMNVLFPGIPFPPGDEDGVTYTALPRGGASAVIVELNSTLGPGRLDAWIDFDGTGIWTAGLPEQITPVTGTVLLPGLNNIPVSVPATAVLGDAAARFRLSSVGGLSPAGLASNGEVEDYLVSICQPGPTNAVTFTNITVASTVSNQVITMEWNSEPNIAYQVQCLTTFSNTPPFIWTNVGAPIIGPANSITFTNTWVFERYYRLCVPYVCP